MNCEPVPFCDRDFNKAKMSITKDSKRASRKNLNKMAIKIAEEHVELEPPRISRHHEAHTSRLKKIGHVPRKDSDKIEPLPKGL
jgi:hypothetical protein